MAALRSSGTWGSALTADEFAAIRSVGFEPVGQVFGAAVYAAGAAAGSACPGAPAAPGDGSEHPGPSLPRRPASGEGPALREGPPRVATEVSGRAGPGSFGPLVQAMDQARRTAVGRLMAECAQLDGQGVVGVHVARGTFPLGGTQFVVIGTAVRGTAVRAIGRPVPAPAAPPAPIPAPFTCDLSGQDFAKLVSAGWIPVGLALGISIGARHDDRDTTRRARWTAGNAEMAGWTDLVNQARHDARRQLESDVHALGAEGVVIAAMPMRVRQRDCPAAVGRRDHIVEATIIGTAIARFARAPHRTDAPPLAVMSLDPHRRQAARRRGWPGFPPDGP